MVLLKNIWFTKDDCNCALLRVVMNWNSLLSIGSSWDYKAINGIAWINVKLFCWREDQSKLLTAGHAIYNMPSFHFLASCISDAADTQYVFWEWDLKGSSPSTVVAPPPILWNTMGSSNWRWTIPLNNWTKFTSFGAVEWHTMS